MSETPSSFSPSSERKWILLFCFLAAVHIFIFSAAFPFFNNVDEREHFDLVVKYSHGHIPVGAETVSAESARYMAFYDVATYLNNPANPPAENPPPPWNQKKLSSALTEKMKTAKAEANYESPQPPLYYAIAGFWWRLGKFFGLTGYNLLYSLRFLNILFVVPVVWLAYATAKMIFPENHFLRIAAPALIAFMPQSAFYSILNDVPSALTFGAAFFCLLKCLRAEKPGILLGAATGLSIAVTFLTKMTNVPLVIIAFIVVVLKFRRLVEEKKWRASLPIFVILFFCAVLPMAVWMMVSKNHFGDFTGAKYKMARFDWTYKSFGDWWSHPIFSPHGLWTYLLGQLATFWQGEFFWRGAPMNFSSLNVIYTILSIILPLAALIGIFKRRKKMAGVQRDALGLSFISFGAILGFFAFLSVIYDFNGSLNPSRAFPYFHAGRMMLGALIPFMLLFVFGLDCALKKFRSVTKFFVLAAFILFMLIFEFITDWPVFQSQYNWFHL